MPAHLTQLTYGALTPVLAYLFSFLGCLLGLKATARARMVSGASRARWLILAAWAIGGTGIWVMHFVAMLGVNVDGSDVRYNLPITIASWLIAVIVVGIGLFVVGYGKPNALKIILAGIFAGAGVATMHYTGMAAMRMDGSTTYDMKLVDASIVIAVVAAIVAFWFTVVLHRTLAIITGAAVMAVAVTAMHYTGMAALRVKLSTVGHPVPGVSSVTLLVPIFIFVIVVAVALGYAMLNSPSEQDAATLDDINARYSGAHVRQPSSVPLTSAFRIPSDL